MTHPTPADLLAYNQRYYRRHPIMEAEASLLRAWRLYRTWERENGVEEATIAKEAEVFGNEDSLFILFKIAEMGNTTLTYLNENLVAPHGWIALARVWRADLIDVIGEYVTVTEAGKRMVADVEVMIEMER